MPTPNASTAILDALSLPENTPLLLGILRGVEKEGLRVNTRGAIANSPHPAALGSSLCHPSITTDYSEALLEFITPPSHRLENLFDTLNDIHAACHLALGDELLWCNSMPCQLAGDASVPIAYYGESNPGRMKSIYRNGLGHRYGRIMQTVAGIHYNFSLPAAFWAFLARQEGSTETLEAFTSRRYFDLIRNFRRYYSLLIYLFGASPALCESFVEGRTHGLIPLQDCPDTLHLPFATALRMGHLGYQSQAQEGLYVCYNTAKSYAKSLVAAINTPYPPYEGIAAGEGGDYQQLNKGLLQIENEFYSAIRPKRTAHFGETALTALCSRGVEYIEVRCLDINPFEPCGLNPPQVRFLDAFLLYCLLTPSPPAHPEESRRILNNQKAVVEEGRKPGLQLEVAQGEWQLLSDWGLNLLKNLTPIAQLLDAAVGQGLYQQAVAEQHNKFHNPQATPSAQALDALKAAKCSFVDWNMQQSAHFQEMYKTALSLTADKQKNFKHLADVSITQQQQEEAKPQMPFADYLTQFYGQYPNCGKGEA